MIISGGCRCGAVRYKIDAEPITARHCWCRDCQYIGAGPRLALREHRRPACRGRIAGALGCRLRRGSYSPTERPGTVNVFFPSESVEVEP
jgi:hypothetical protein